MYAIFGYVGYVLVYIIMFIHFISPSFFDSTTQMHNYNYYCLTRLPMKILARHLGDLYHIILSLSLEMFGKRYGVNHIVFSMRIFALANENVFLFR